MSNKINKERLKIISDDIKWYQEVFPLLDDTNPDDVILRQKFEARAKEHQEYLNNIKKTLGIE